MSFRSRASAFLLISSALLGNASITESKRVKTSLHIPEKIIGGVIDIVQNHKNKPVQGQIQLQAGYQHNQNTFQQAQGGFQGQGGFQHGSEISQQSQSNVQSQGGFQGNFQQNQHQGNFQGQGGLQQVQNGFHGQSNFQQGQNNLQQNQVNYPQHQGTFQQSQGSFQQNQGNFQQNQGNYQHQQSYPQYQQQWAPPHNQYQPTWHPQLQQGQFQGQGQVGSEFSQTGQMSASQTGQISSSHTGQISQITGVSYPQGTLVPSNGQYQGQAPILPINQGGGFQIQGQYQEPRPQIPVSTVSNHKPAHSAPVPTCICQAWTKPQKLTEEATLSKGNKLPEEKSVSTSVGKKD